MGSILLFYLVNEPSGTISKVIIFPKAYDSINKVAQQSSNLDWKLRNLSYEWNIEPCLKSETQVRSFKFQKWNQFNPPFSVEIIQQLY